MRKFLFAIFVFALSTAAAAQSSVVPIAELKHGGLLGGVQNGKWIAPTGFSQRMAAETEFVLVSWSGVEEGGVTLGKKGPMEDVCQDFVRMEFELQQDHGVAIGTTAKWNPVPRIPNAIEPKRPANRTDVDNFLKRK